MRNAPFMPSWNQKNTALLQVYISPFWFLTFVFEENTWQVIYRADMYALVDRKYETQFQLDLNTTHNELYEYVW